MKGEIKAVAGTKFARQIASANSKVLRTHMNSNEIAAWNHRIDVEKAAKQKAKAERRLERNAAKL